MVVVDYIVTNKRWNNFLNNFAIEKYISKIFTIIMETINYKINRKKTIEISITFTNDNKIRKINKQFRNCDKATNVLSFPLYEKEFINVIKNEDFVELGDIILSFDTISRESKEQQKMFENHLTHLIVHSILHLLGYDHINSEEAKEMENIEIVVLDKLDIKNPYVVDFTNQY